MASISHQDLSQVSNLFDIPSQILANMPKCSWNGCVVFGAAPFHGIDEILSQRPSNDDVQLSIIYEHPAIKRSSTLENELLVKTYL